jgi:hypothetical protein
LRRPRMAEKLGEGFMKADNCRWDDSGDPLGEFALLFNRLFARLFPLPMVRKRSHPRRPCVRLLAASPVSCVFHGVVSSTGVGHAATTGINVLKSSRPFSLCGVPSSYYF